MVVFAHGAGDGVDDPFNVTMCGCPFLGEFRFGPN
jgi:hypothetical protein